MVRTSVSGPKFRFPSLPNTEYVLVKYVGTESICGLDSVLSYHEVQRTGHSHQNDDYIADVAIYDDISPPWWVSTKAICFICSSVINWHAYSYSYVK